MDCMSSLQSRSSLSSDSRDSSKDSDGEDTGSARQTGVVSNSFTILTADIHRTIDD